MWDFKSFYPKIAMIDDKGEQYTYKQLDDEQDKFAQSLEERQLIFIVCTNTIECITAYVSCIINKIPVMLIDIHIMQEKLEELIVAFEPLYIYMPHRYGELKLKCNKYIEVERKKDYSLLKITEHNVYYINEGLALLLSTSGSTGESKHVRISYINLYSNTKSIVSTLGIEAGDKAITSLPMNYCYGLSVINTHLYVGATLLITDEKVISKKFWDFASSKKMSIFAGVPYTYEVLKKLKIFEKNDVKFKKLLQAGGKLNEEMEKYLRDYSSKNNVELYIMYGQTEATARMSCLKVRGNEYFGSVGQALEGGKFEIVLDNGRVAMPYEKGEIIYEGKNVSLGYATRKEDLNSEDTRKGVLKTKDVGYLDEEGYLYVTGRMDRMVKIQGLRIKLEYIEKCLLEKFGGYYRVSYENGILYIKSTDLNGQEVEYVSKLIGINHRVIKSDILLQMYRK